MPLPSGRALRALLLGAATGALIPVSALADDSDGDRPTTVSPVEITARTDAPIATASPATTESADAGTLRDTVNAVNAEDTVKYLPSLLVRKRHVGDTQGPLATRTSGVGSSARSLIFVDGVLLSALIGNNNSTASPRWGMVSPEEIVRVDVAYGPFSAAYAGNSIGAVVNITTRTPTRFEGSLKVAGSWDDFSQYGTKGVFPAGQLAATLGDGWGDVAWFLSADHVKSRSQPLASVTAVRPAAPSAAGAVTTGAFQDLNRTGAVIQVLGAGGFEDQSQDTLKAKLSWSPGPAFHVSWLGGVFLNDTRATAETYLRDTTGDRVYSGTLNIGGYAYTVAPSAFANNVYRFNERHWMNALSAGGVVGADFTWRATASLYDYDKDEQRTPSAALPAASTGGPGSIARLDGTGWRTFDLSGEWRVNATHALSFGVHSDRYRLASQRFNTGDWIGGAPTTLASASRGKTRTDAVWLQDAITLSPDLMATLGARQEHWEALDGYNSSLAPALSVAQPLVSADAFSPKATVRWTPDEHWSVTGSFGQASRFPTVTELYQTVTTGPTLSVPDPNLRPETAWSTELAIERADASGRVRLSLFAEDIDDALIAQTAPLVPGSATLFTYVQNVGHVRSRGVELVVERRDLAVRGFDLSGSVTWLDSTITEDPAFPAAVGKQAPQTPRWRATVVATWRPSPALALTLAARYSDRVFATIDNTDPVTHTFQGFDGYLVADARANWTINGHWSAAIGVDNLGARDYFLFHPFPQRTAFAELRYAF
ncbi:MAG: putative TonB-dependent siderophore receptor [Caulobacter sp.]|nr:putative TonB-dependent siderophore receptor [Caulobacter sp.]